MFWRKRPKDDFSAELRSHLDLEAERLRAEGVSEDEAYARARRALGNVTRSEERFYESRRLLWLSHLGQDLRYALRQLWHNKAFTLIGVATLALGIGANTAIFTLVHAVMFNTLPVSRPGELYRLGAGDNCCVMTGYQEGQDFALFSYDLYKTLRDGTPEIASMAAFQPALGTESIRRAGTPEVEQPFVTEYVSSNYFELFGIKQASGNFFDARQEGGGSAVSRRRQLPGVGESLRPRSGNRGVDVSHPGQAVHRDWCCAGRILRRHAAQRSISRPNGGMSRRAVLSLAPDIAATSTGNTFRLPARGAEWASCGLRIATGYCCS